MRGIAFQTEIVDLLTDLFGVIGCPFVVRGEELDAFVTHFGDRLEGTGQVLFQLSANRIEVEPDGNRGLLRGGGKWNCAQGGDKRAARKSGSVHGRQDT